jgi:hypothetical protein
MKEKKWLSFMAATACLFIQAGQPPAEADAKRNEKENWFDYQTPVFTWVKGDSMLKNLQTQKERLLNANIAFQFEWLSARTNATVSIDEVLTNVPLGEVLCQVLDLEMLHTVRRENTLFVFDRADYNDTDCQVFVFGEIRNNENGPVRNITVFVKSESGRMTQVPVIIDTNGRFFCQFSYRATLRYIKIGEKRFAIGEYIEKDDKISSISFLADECDPFVIDTAKHGLPKAEQMIVLRKKGKQPDGSRFHR